jgi:uncharacterized protein (TIGR04255 family)
MERKCRYVPLDKKPLVLVLAQVRFSPILKMGSYIPEIQEEFRRNGFPIDRSGVFPQLVLGPAGGLPFKIEPQQRWEYRTKKQRTSIILSADGLVLQETAYTRFEDFAATLHLALRTVLTKTEHDRLGVVQRIGLRYIDIIVPGPGEDHRAYLRPGLHGVADPVFKPGTNRLHATSVGRTVVDGHDGTLVIQIQQNDQGQALPPDLVAAAPELDARARPGEVVTLVDMDHYLEDSFEPDADWVVARSYAMHDQLVEVFHDHVVTEQAIEVWR